MKMKFFLIQSKRISLICRIMNELINILFQIILYFGIVAIIAYFIYPLHDNIDNYFKNKVVWITGKYMNIIEIQTR